MLAVSFSSYASPKNENPVKPGVISGKVIDNTTKDVLPYVNVVVRDLANKVLTGGITEENGTFIIKDIPKGKSVVEVQFMGYKSFKKEITVTSQNKKIDLGTIALVEESAQLDEVVVRAETSTVVQKVDRKVINVGKDLTAAGTTASEMLNNVQSLSVDSQTGNISLRGNENVRVLVDGKPSNIPVADLLKQIPSTSIKSIELITNPSAKYNPEGMSGIINIILNKNANIGFNGSLNTGVTVGHYPKYNASTNMNYKTGKVNFFMNYGNNYSDNQNFGFVERPGVNSQNFYFTSNNVSNLLKLGADIYLNDKNTLSFYLTQNWFDNDFGGESVVAYNGVVTNDGRNSIVGKSKNNTYNVNYSLDFEKEGHNLEAEFTYSDNDSPSTLNQFDLLDPSNLELNYYNELKSTRTNTLFNLDYTNPLSETAKLELGVEYRSDRTDNLNETNQLGFNNSSFDYERNIYSFYTSYNQSFGKFTMQLGARIEQFEAEGFFNQENVGTETVTDKIFTIYPSAFFTYSASDINQFQLSYSRRVDRPGIQQINPIREWSTPLITSVGNKDLDPQFTNSFEVNYTRKLKKGSVTVGTFYRKVNDVISRVTFQDASDPSGTKQILSFANFEDTNAYGLELSLNYRLAKWWMVNSSMDFYSQKQFGVADLTNPNASRIEVQNEAFNARVSNSFTATKKLRFQLFAMYRGANRDIQWDVKPMWMVNLGASYSVLQGKGTLSFRVNDIFKGMKFGFDSTNPYVQNGQFNWESRTAYVGFNYRFGGGKNRAKSRRQRDSNEKQGGGGFF